MTHDWLKRPCHGLYFLKPEYRAKERCGSLVFYQSPWLIICWDDIKIIARWRWRYTAYPNFTSSFSSDSVNLLFSTSDSSINRAVFLFLFRCSYDPLSAASPINGRQRLQLGLQGTNLMVADGVTFHRKLHYAINIYLMVRSWSKKICLSPL